ncbi:MAG: hypothetical protein OQK04_16315, partial [Kangiellaceae bacterium]|nr:hypothetical protein [Kangiellaceae bacterium]
MKSALKLMFGVVALFFSQLATSLPNSSIDLVYKGKKLLDHQEVSNAHLSVAKLDDGKIAFESGLTNKLLQQDVVTSVHYVDLDGNIQLKFSGTNDGVVNISISGISVGASGKGKEDGVRFDWDMSINNIEVIGQYSFITGELSNIELLDNYRVSTDFDAKGIIGFFVDLIDALGIFDTEQFISNWAKDYIESKLDSMFAEKFNGFSKSFFALDEVVPETIMYEGRNISPELIQYLVKPIKGKSITITTSLNNNNNQTVSINLWNDFILTARRIKPIITNVDYEYLNCIGADRRGLISWNNTDTES